MVINFHDGQVSTGVSSVTGYPETPNEFRVHLEPEFVQNEFGVDSLLNKGWKKLSP